MRKKKEDKKKNEKMKMRMQNNEKEKKDKKKNKKMKMRMQNNNEKEGFFRWALHTLLCWCILCQIFS